MESFSKCFIFACLMIAIGVLTTSYFAFDLIGEQEGSGGLGLPMNSEQGINPVQQVISRTVSARYRVGVDTARQETYHLPSPFLHHNGGLALGHYARARARPIALAVDSVSQSHAREGKHDSRYALSL